MRVFLVFLALFATLAANDGFMGENYYKQGYGKGDGYGKGGYYKDGKKGKKEVKPVDNELYKKECASCHFGYQPGLLPKASWEHIFATLDKHYGVDASLDEKDAKALKEYVLANSSETAKEYKRSVKLTKSLRPGVLYTSITQIPYHKKKHKDLKEWMYTQKEVRTLANCSACHKKADDGVFSKKSVDIPNYGAWRD